MGGGTVPQRRIQSSFALKNRQQFNLLDECLTNYALLAMCVARLNGQLHLSQVVIMKSEIHLYGEGQPSPVTIQVAEESVVRDVIVAAQQAGFLPRDANLMEILVFEVEDDEPMPHDKAIKHPEKKRHRFHFHRCRTIEVTVMFNLLKHSRAFPPSTSVLKVLQWALREFHLSGTDAENKELRIGGPTGQAMLEGAPIGSYTKDCKCELLAYLTDIVQVNG